MAQNITLMGASYSDVPSVALPKTGGGTASFTDVTDTTATASDVASGKYFYLASGEKVQGSASGGSGDGYVWQDAQGYVHLSDEEGTHVTVESLSVTQNGTYTAPTGKAYSPVSVSVSGGGGGASNIEIGTFNYDSTYAGTAQDITLNYNGNGYPVSVMIFAAEGAYNSDGTCYNTSKRYGLVTFCMVKSVLTGLDATPSYTGTANGDYGTTFYKYKNSISPTYSLTNSGGTSNFSYNDVSASVTAPALAVTVRAKNKISVFMADSSYGFIPGIEYRYIIYFSE